MASQAKERVTFKLRILDELTHLLSVEAKESCKKSGRKRPAQDTLDKADCRGCEALGTLSMSTLRARCKKASLRANGRKVDLSARLRANCRCRLKETTTNQDCSDVDVNLSKTVAFEILLLEDEDGEALETAILLTLLNAPSHQFGICRNGQGRILVSSTDMRVSEDIILSLMPASISDAVKISRVGIEASDTFAISVKVNFYVRMLIMSVARKLGYLAFRVDSSILIDVIRQRQVSFHVVVEMLPQDGAFVTVVFSRVRPIRCLPVRAEHVDHAISDRVEVMLLPLMESKQIIAMEREPDPWSASEMIMRPVSWRPTTAEEARWFWHNAFGISLTNDSEANDETRRFARVIPTTKLKYNG